MACVRSGSVRALVAASVALVGSVAVAAPSSGVQPSAVAQGGAPEVGPGASPDEAAIVPLTPARVLDTREPVGVAKAGPVGAEGVVELQVTGRGGVPESGVAGVVLNVTVTQPTAPSFVTVWPTGQPRPLASSLNVAPGETFANMVVAKVGDGGRVSLYNRAGMAHVIADVSGWVPEGGDLTTITPARLMDTRDGTGGHTGVVGADGSVDLDVVGIGGVPATGVGSVILNVTATEPTAPSFVTLWPTGEPRPLASSLNMVSGQTIPNLVIAKVGNDGKVSLYNAKGATHLVVDVVGHAPPDSTLVALTPERVLDTRDGTGGTTGAVPADTAIELDVTGVGGVPDSGVTGVLVNVTTTAATAPSFVTTWPNGLSRPEASSLNMVAGQTVPNLVLAPVGAGGKIRLYNRAGNAHLIADVVAYLTPPAGVTATVIADETIAVEPEQITTIDGDPDADDTVTITFEPDAEIAVGSIIVAPPMSGAPSGILRRVTGITVGPGGVIIAVTERATLTDAVPEGSFDVLAPADGGLARLPESSTPIGTSAYDRSLGCGTSVVLSTSVDGSIDASINFALDWDLSGLHSANVIVGLDVILNLQAAATAALTCEATAELFSVAFSPIAVPIAGFPFFFVPELSLDLKAGGSLQGSISGTADYGVQITAGIVYDEATGIDTVAAVTPTANSDWTASAAATAGVELTPKLVLAAYGLGGPEAGVPFGVSVDLDPCRTPLWKLASSIKATIGIALTSWLGGLTLANTEFTLNENVIAQGGDPIPDFPGCAIFRPTHYRVQAAGGASAERVVWSGGSLIETTDDYIQFLSRSSWWASQGGALSRLETTENTAGRNGVIISGSVDPVITEPYDGPIPDVNPQAVAASVLGADASASGSASLDYGSVDDTWNIVASVESAAEREFDDSTYFNGDGNVYFATAASDAWVELEFDLTSTVDMTFAPACPPDGLNVVLLGPTSLNVSGCLLSGLLEPGSYRLEVIASGWVIRPGVSETFTMSLSPP